MISIDKLEDKISVLQQHYQLLIQKNKYNRFIQIEQEVNKLLEQKSKNIKKQAIDKLKKIRLTSPVGNMNNKQKIKLINRQSQNIKILTQKYKEVLSNAKYLELKPILNITNQSHIIQQLSTNIPIENAQYKPQQTGKQRQLLVEQFNGCKQKGEQLVQNSNLLVYEINKKIMKMRDFFESK